VSEPQKKKGLSAEIRIVLASLLSMVVILLWAKYFAPKPPATPAQANRPGVSAPAAANPATPSTVTPPSSTAGQTMPAGKATAIAPANAAAMPPRADTQERTIVVENSLYRVEISNRGGVVKSWELKNYMDDAKPPHVLDLVHPKASEQTGGWPFALVVEDPQLELQANSALYQASVGEPGARAGETQNYVSLPANALKAPAALELTWSDGHLEVTKTIHFDDSYVVRVESSVKFNGARINAGVAWLGGFGDLTVANPAPVDRVLVFYSENGSLTNLSYKKLEGPEKWGPGIWQGGKDFTGIQDTYFTAAFLPIQGAPRGSLETRYWKVTHPVQVEGKDQQEPVQEVAASSAGQPLALRVYVGPKDYDVLKKMNPPMQALVNFGWLEVIAGPLFYLLKWIHIYVPNWGWSIVVLTLIINMFMFPLRISGYRTTLKMQRVAPEIKQIQDRYKKYKMNDPKKQEMNKEIMAIYSREGINPVGGCIPQLLQLPIWYGLYRALQGTIELRHAPWFWWIKDLSAKDPYYILPILMGVSMYLASKMTPMPASDAQQQAMVKYMPLMMSGLFLVIPYPSGLAVYILTSGVVGVFQQWYLNRKHPPMPPAKLVRGKKS
jgi:YidC/Oxa1 family membrane protein insertase